MPIPVRHVLDSPAAPGARLVAGAGGLDRECSWTSVIESQAVGFVRPGELVMTTGVGLDGPALTAFLSSIVETDAAALCVSLPPSAPERDVPAAVLAVADQRRFPVIELPWDVSFADVSRWATDELMRRRFEASLDAPDRMLARFAAAVLRGDGMDGIACGLEVALERPVLVLDARLRLAGRGPRARSVLGDEALAALPSRAAGLPELSLRALARRLASSHGRRMEGLPELALGPGFARAAVARHERVGVLYVLSGPGERDDALSFLEARAIEDAAAAVAMEALHRRTFADDRAREEFLWQAVASRTGTAEQTTARAADLGIDVRVPYELAVARLASSGDGGRTASDLGQLACELRERAPAAGSRLLLTVRDETLVAVLAAPDRREGALRRLVSALHAGPDAAVASWGVASAARAVSEWHVAFAEARRALDVGCALHEPPIVACAADLQPFMMLGSLGSDPQAVAIALGVVQPLVDYDRATARNLVETLDVYLQESGNTSSAARRLFLNRHSLVYRLHKIETLTGRSLERPEDRFVLDLSIKLLRFGVLAPDAARHA